MDIPEKLLKFKVHILIGAILSLLLIFLVYLAPSFLDILKYFWPLLVSTALFLVAIVVFGRISPPPPEASVEKAGEGILDYVAGEPDNLQTQVDEHDSAEEAAVSAPASAAAAAKGKGIAENDDE
ncbi:unnamed protein product [Coffea canephora]|uniref:Transmembrane protein n=1 Tax=Coffea canephora TaxID=49390 RepID=A0A068UZS5_COFCA|nr:uncharacterized protein LOC113689905 [Coffea arabica]CDP13724.1 unnamed protein product [Coffea canephora]